MWIQISKPICYGTSQEEVKTSFLDTLDGAVGTKDDETEDINAKNAKQMREQQDKRTHEE